MGFSDRARAAAAGGLLSVLLVPLVACSPPPVPRDAVRERVEALASPDIVLIVIDTLRADWTPPVNGDPEQMPELARWAERGVTFERNRAQSSWTKISMASMMTSLWPRSHGITEPNDGLSDGAVTLAEELKAAGYETLGVQTNGWLHQSFGFHQGFDRYLFPAGGGQEKFGQASVWSNADRVVDEAEHLIEERDPERPMFLYLHFMDVHEYAAPPEYKTFGTDNEGAYRASMRWVDDGLKRVREALSDAGTLDQTVIILTSDHGETFGEHGVHGHARNVLTPVVWVPLVMRLPFATEPIRVQSQVRGVDLAPTLLDVAGLPVPEAFEGESLLPLITGEAPETDRSSYAALGFPLFQDASVQQAANSGDWTFARNLSGPEDDPTAYLNRAVRPGEELLFDRTIDPGENVNLVKREATQAEAMRSEIEAHWEAEVDVDAKESGVRIDPGIAEKLRAMGYLQ